jgi:hypothetical protein
MKRLFSMLGLTCFIAGSIVTAQGPVRPADSGIVQGVVLRSGTREPIANAEVRLLDTAVMQGLEQAIGVALNRPASLPGDLILQLAQEFANAPPGARPPVPALNRDVVQAELLRVTQTDNDGRFVFRGVKPGQYTVRATRDGYFGGSVNSGSFGLAKTDVTIAADRTVDVELSMLSGGTIAGRVLKDGVPQVGLNVQAVVVSYENGYRILQVISNRTTDDRGQYRLFHLPPGEYFVAATPRQTPLRAAAPGALPTAPVEQALRSFHPATADASIAVPLIVLEGTEIPGADIALQTARTFKVSGEIRTAIPIDTIPGPLPTGASRTPSVMASLGFALHDPDAPDDAGGTSINGGIPLTQSGSQLSGKFEVTGVVPGSYDWRAYFNQNTPDGSFVTTAVVPIEVRDHDVEGLLIEINPIVRVNGVATIDGGAPGDVPVRLSLQVEGSSAKRPGYISIASRIVTAAKDGTFMIPGIQNGRFRVMMATGLPRNLYLADVRQGPATVLDTGFDIGREQPAPLQVMLRTGAGVIEGVVNDAYKKPVAGATVAVVPTIPLRHNRARYQTATSDINGRFVIGNIIPGNYKVFAWDDIPNGAYFNSKFISRYEDRGFAISVLQSSTRTVELTVLPAR